MNSVTEGEGEGRLLLNNKINQTQLADKQPKIKATKPQKNHYPKQLEPYRFKPGNNANPKGRPKSVLTKRERKQLLSEYAKANPEKANPIEAIRELNKMEGAYVQEELEGAALFFEFLRTLRGYNPQQLPEAKKPEVIEGGED